MVSGEGYIIYIRKKYGELREIAERQYKSVCLFRWRQFIANPDFVCQLRQEKWAWEAYPKENPAIKKEA